MTDSKPEMVTVTGREVLVTHPNDKCYGHLEWSDKGTTLVVDHCECDYNGQHPTVGCVKCGATDIPVIGHRCES